MSASRDILNAIAPEFADEPRADLFLTLAAQRIRPSAFGALYGQAVAYLAAHMLTMSPDDGGEGAASAGPVTSRGAGALSIGYGAPGAAASGHVDAALQQTRYGREYLAILRSRAVTAPSVL